MKLYNHYTPLEFAYIVTFLCIYLKLNFSLQLTKQNGRVNKVEPQTQTPQRMQLTCIASHSKCQTEMFPNTNHNLAYLFLYPFGNVYATLLCAHTHTYYMLFCKSVASKNFPPKSLMSRVASNRLAINHPTNLFSQNGTSPRNVFVHIASSVRNLKFLEDNLLIPPSGVKNQKRSPETSVRNYHYSLRNNPDESSSHLLRGGNLNHA